MTPGSPDLDAVKQGFSAMAEEYDALAQTHPIVVWMRSRIRALVEAQLSPGASILEISAGSGLDAAYFAGQGFRVHATDIAPGMLAALAAKAARGDAGGRLTFEALSNTELTRVSGGPYDLVFSNLGGLNCINDLSLVTRDLPSLLRPTGMSVLVVMPRFCPWELAVGLKGNRSVGFRRLSRRGTLANVGGATVPVWYHAPGELARALGPRFETVALRSFCCFCPPSYFDGFAARHPGLTRRLMRLDDRLGSTWPMRQLGDFYALVSRLKS